MQNESSVLYVMDFFRHNGYEKKRLSLNNATLRSLAPDFIGYKPQVHDKLISSVCSDAARDLKKLIL